MTTTRAGSLERVRVPNRSAPYSLEALDGPDRAAVESNCPSLVEDGSLLPFDEQVRRLLTGRLSRGERLVIPPVGVVGWDLSFQRSPVFVRREVIWAALGLREESHRHAHVVEVGVSNVANLPSLLRYSPVTTKSRTRDDSLVATLDCKDVAGSQVIAALWEHEPAYGRRWELTSVYGKDNYLDFLGRTIDDGKAVYGCPVLCDAWANREALELVVCTGGRYAGESLADMISRATEAQVEASRGMSVREPTSPSLDAAPGGGALRMRDRRHGRML